MTAVELKSCRVEASGLAGAGSVLPAVVLDTRKPAGVHCRECRIGAARNARQWVTTGSRPTSRWMAEESFMLAANGAPKSLISLSDHTLGFSSSSNLHMEAGLAALFPSSTGH